MTKFSVRVLAVAREDVIGIAQYIMLDNPPAAMTFLEKFESSVAHLERHPFICKLMDEADVSGRGYRALVMGNYMVVYRVSDDEIQVLRVLHGARDYRHLL